MAGAAASVLGLSGCVGFLVRNTQECEVSDWGATRDEVALRRGLPDKYTTAGATEEWIYTVEANRWCGIMPWVILPIPLMLPLCHETDRVVFVDGKTQASYITRVHRTGFVFLIKGAGAIDEDCSGRR